MLSRPLNRSEVMGAIVALGLLLGLLIFPVYASNGRSYRTACLSNVKQIAVGTAMYLSDFDERMPHLQWNEQLFPYIKNASIFVCPQIKPGKGSGYAMNGRVRGMLSLKEENPAELVTYFETNDLTLGAVAWTLEPLDSDRHPNTVNAAFLDGHAKGIRDDGFGNIRLTVKSVPPAKK